MENMGSSPGTSLTGFVEPGANPLSSWKLSFILGKAGERWVACFVEFRDSGGSDDSS